MVHITSHILDTSKGKPANGVDVKFSVLEDTDWKLLAESVTNSDGRTENLAGALSELKSGSYKLQFKTSSYFQANYGTVFYPWIDVVFNVEDGSEKYHIKVNRIAHTQILAIIYLFLVS